MSESFIEEVRFGDFRFEIRAYSASPRDRWKLFRGVEGKKEIAVQPRDLHLLEKLLDIEPGQIIERRDLAFVVWGTRAAVGNVEHSIGVLREAMDDKSHKIIGTVRARGYVFLKPVERSSRLARDPLLQYMDSAEDADEEDLGTAFDEFFGVPKPDHDGVIVLQSDLLDMVLPSSGRPLDYSTSRLYKARSFVNTFDLNGALMIQNAFEKRRRKAPQLVVAEHNVRNSSHHAASFKLSMGLGFTDETTRTIQNQTCGSWMRVSRTSGDALSIRKDLIEPVKKSLLRSEPDSEKAGFERLVPVDWGPNYVDEWIRMLPPWNGPEVRDYALIYRNTRMIAGRQVLFVVAGFTERSTNVAAKYLAENWLQLWSKYVRLHPYDKSLGDFLVVIEGPSDVDRLAEWSQIAELELTPEVLKRKGVDCEWVDRLSE